MASKIRNALKIGAQLDVYKIEKILGQGGFGITYLAEDVNLEKKVAIKEYLPIGLAMRDGRSQVEPQSTEAEADFRWGLEQFLGEAKTLAKFQHPNIVQVLRFFEANGTAYIVMNFVQGESLHDRMQRKKKIDEAELKRFLFPLLDGLESIHNSGFLHRDIKPGNIFIAEDGEPMLLDFGAARSALVDAGRGLTAIVTRGYAPIEQYSKRGHQGPWTDIYALAGVLYEIVTGKDPVEATDRVIEDPQLPAFGAGVGRLSDTLLQAIDHALAVHPENRPRSVAAWRAELEGETSVPAMEPASAMAVSIASEVASDLPAQPKLAGDEDDPPKKKGARPTGPSRDPSRRRPRRRASGPARERSSHTIVAGWKGLPVQALPPPAGLRSRRGRTIAASIVFLIVAGLSALTATLWPPAVERTVSAEIIVKPDFSAEERRFAEMLRAYGRERAEAARRAKEKEKKVAEKQKTEKTAELRGLMAGSQVAFIRNQGIGRHEARWTFHVGGRLEGAAFDSGSGDEDELNSTSDRGKWWVDGTTLCLRWNRWDRRRTRCYGITRVRGPVYVAHGKGGPLSGRFRLEK